MYFARIKQIIRQICSSSLCVPIFILCVSVCVIYVSTSNKDIDFNAKFDKHKWIHRTKDIITGTTAPPTKLPPSRYLTYLNNPMYLWFFLPTIALIIWIYRFISGLCRIHVLRRVEPVREPVGEPVAHFRNDNARVYFTSRDRNLALDAARYSSDEEDGS